MYSCSTLQERRSKHFTTINTFKFTEASGCVGGKQLEFPFQEREELSGNTQGCKSKRCTWVHWLSLDSSPGIPTVQQWSLRRPPAAPRCSLPLTYPSGTLQLTQHPEKMCVHWKILERRMSDLTQCLTHCIPPPTPQEVLIQPLLQCMCVHVMLLQSCLTLCSSKDYSPQAPLSVVFSRQGYWSRLPCSPPGDLPDPGIKPVFLLSPALASKLFTTSPTWIPGLIRSWHSCGSFFQSWPTVSRKMRAETLLRTCWLEGKFGRTQEPRQLS